MSLPTSNDEIRSVYNRLERESKDPKRSFTAALARSAFIADDEETLDLLHKQSMNFLEHESLKSRKRVSVQNVENGSMENLEKFLDSLSSGSDRFKNSQPFSFGKYLELADELSMASSYAAKAAQTSLIAQQQLQQPMPHNQPVPMPASKEKFHVMEDINTKRDKTDKRNIVDVEGDVDSSLTKKNSFSSAKDRYQQEGGKLDKNQRKPENKSSNKSDSSSDEALPPELAHCDKALVEKIEADIIHHGQTITFDDIAGLDFAKECVIELICWPMKQPQLFQGLRSLPRGVLLFGPPGTGKTLIGKAIAHQSGATFFSISASSLMSKWIGEGEKTVRTLFAVAAYRQPSVVFIDEVDSLLCQRSSDENEATRRIKTEFMVQLDGANTNLDARVVIIGATNRPEELDEAVRRRFVKRLYIPLPDELSRRALLETLLADVFHKIDESGIETLTQRTDGYSGADIRSLCTEAAMGPIRELAQLRKGDLKNISDSDVPPITLRHFDAAFDTVAPSVSQNDLKRYIDWNTTYGSYRRMF